MLVLCPVAGDQFNRPRVAAVGSKRTIEELLRAVGPAPSDWHPAAFVFYRVKSLATRETGGTLQGGVRGADAACALDFREQVCDAVSALRMPGVMQTQAAHEKPTHRAALESHTQFGLVRPPLRRPP